MRSLVLNLISKIDSFTEYTGKCVSSLIIILVTLVGFDVSMRYLFNSGSIAIQELEWHIFSIIILLGSAYTLKHNEHVIDKCEKLADEMGFAQFKVKKTYRVGNNDSTSQPIELPTNKKYINKFHRNYRQCLLKAIKRKSTRKKMHL